MPFSPDLILDDQLELIDPPLKNAIINPQAYNNLSDEWKKRAYFVNRKGELNVNYQEIGISFYKSRDNKLYAVFNNAPWTGAEVEIFRPGGIFQPKMDLSPLFTASQKKITPEQQNEIQTKHHKNLRSKADREEVAEIKSPIKHSHAYKELEKYADKLSGSKNELEKYKGEFLKGFLNQFNQAKTPTEFMEAKERLNLLVDSPKQFPQLNPRPNKFLFFDFTAKSVEKTESYKRLSNLKKFIDENFQPQVENLQKISLS